MSNIAICEDPGCAFVLRVWADRPAPECCPVCGEQMLTECPACGRPLRATTGRCSECGRRVRRGKVVA